MRFYEKRGLITVFAIILLIISVYMFSSANSTQLSSAIGLNKLMKRVMYSHVEEFAEPKLIGFHHAHSAKQDVGCTLGCSTSIKLGGSQTQRLERLKRKLEDSFTKVLLEERSKIPTLTTTFILDQYENTNELTNDSSDFIDI